MERYLPLKEGYLAIIINLGEADGTEVMLGKHLGENTTVWIPDGTKITIHDDLWELPDCTCTITDIKSGLEIKGKFMPAKHLLRIRGKFTPLKQFKPISFTV